MKVIWVSFLVSFLAIVASGDCGPFPVQFTLFLVQGVPSFPGRGKGSHALEGLEIGAELVHPLSLDKVAFIEELHFLSSTTARSAGMIGDME